MKRKRHSEEQIAFALWQVEAGTAVEALDRLARERGKLKSLRVDNGPEFTGKMLDQ